MRDGFDPSPELEAELKLEVRKIIGPFATPDVIIITPGLPKTRSGKVSTHPNDQANLYHSDYAPYPPQNCG